VTGETLGPKPLLEITPEGYYGLYNALGPDGHGAFVLKDAIPQPYLDAILEEALNPELVPFRDVHDRYYNQAGKLIIQNHTVCAFKLLQGDPSYIERLPKMRNMAGEIEQLIRRLGIVFPSLNDWTADEMSLHRYDDPDIGLSFHRDNLRFNGLVAVLSIEGESDFCILDDNGVIYDHPVRPGDLTFTRAPGLFDSDEDIRGQHGVYRLRTPYRTSFIVRANSQPDDTLKGFEYANWDMLPDDNPYRST
jgi:hypothetical protein